jgi:hypothetical protein
VEKTSCQEALQTIFSARLDIFYPPKFLLISQISRFSTATRFYASNPRCYHSCNSEVEVMHKPLVVCLAAVALVSIPQFVAAQGHSAARSSGLCRSPRRLRETPCGRNERPTISHLSSLTQWTFDRRQTPISWQVERPHRSLSRNCTRFALRGGASVSMARLGGWKFRK